MYMIVGVHVQYMYVAYSDISESRLAIGKKMGADQIVVVDSRDARAVAVDMEIQATHRGIHPYTRIPVHG